MSVLAFLVLELIGLIVGQLVVAVLTAPLRILDELPFARPEATVWCGVLGAVLGAASCAVFPERIVGHVPLPGASLVLVPVACAATMYVLGLIVRPRRGRSAHFRTWYGGAGFGLGYAAARLTIMSLVARSAGA